MAKKKSKSAPAANKKSATPKAAARKPVKKSAASNTAARKTTKTAAASNGAARKAAKTAKKTATSKGAAQKAVKKPTTPKVEARKTVKGKKETAAKVTSVPVEKVPRPARGLQETDKGQRGFEQESGPRGWLMPLLESAYTKLVPRGELLAGATRGAARGPVALTGGAAAGFRSRFQPGVGESILADVSQSVWLDRLSAYKMRKAATAQATGLPAHAVGSRGPAVPGQKNWVFLGPSVILNGQAQGLPPIGGRVAGLAVAPGGRLVYAASANGGVFRSDDAGMTWRALMDAFDLQPTDFASTSLACGAIAIDRNDPRRIYVGTGEGDTNAIFTRRITNALPAYRGVGPIRSDDGGDNWVSEPSASGSPTLAGKAFFALAVDPANRENVVGATSDGLFQRVIGAANKPEWVQRRTGVHSSVVVTSASNVTRFCAAEWGKGVFQSADGATWTPLGTGFPNQDVGRIALGVQFNNSNLVYAIVANTDGALLGVYRLDGPATAWKLIEDAPDVLPVDASGGSQGDYDLAIAVDPTDPDLIYLGGSYYNDPQFWPSSIWRCKIVASGSGYRVGTSDPIGERVHADVHALVHSPGDPNGLWATCDGGVFLNRDPRNSDNFDARNNGLACLCPNYFGQHPTDPSTLFSGFQDNGTARTSGGPIWKHVNGGDGGYCLINWSNPQQVLVFANGRVYRATDGGQDHNSWSQRQFPWRMMTEPIDGPPYNPSKPADANVVAVAAGSEVYISTDFGASWASTPLAIPTQGGVFSMEFVSGARFYVGTTAGEVFVVERSTGSWQVRRIDSAVGGALGLQGLISDISVDWADTSGNSVYITFGGMGDYRHVWHFDGTRWQARSGPPGSNMSNLLDVEHNAVVVDPKAPANVYVGADIGVWHSPDSGQSWKPLPNGLPEAPVFDLQIHPTRHLLRATTHGRGLFEYRLDP